MASKLYLYILNHLLKKALTGRIKKEGKRETQKFEHLEKGKIFR